MAAPPPLPAGARQGHVLLPAGRTSREVATPPATAPAAVARRQRAAGPAPGPRARSKSRSPILGSLSWPRSRPRFPTRSRPRIPPGRPRPFPGWFAPRGARRRWKAPAPKAGAAAAPPCPDPSGRGAGGSLGRGVPARPCHEWEGDFCSRHQPECAGPGLPAFSPILRWVFLPLPPPEDPPAPPGLRRARSQTALGCARRAPSKLPVTGIKPFRPLSRGSAGKVTETCLVLTNAPRPPEPLAMPQSPLAPRGHASPGPGEPPAAAAGGTGSSEEPPARCAAPGPVRSPRPRCARDPLSGSTVPATASGSRSRAAERTETPDLTRGRHRRPPLAPGPGPLSRLHRSIPAARRQRSLKTTGRAPAAPASPPRLPGVTP
ncbi:basic proline-rich protein-like [Apus apus]|uniref:basic proline-rich protein-like n=1 Tax=Apus apus TaxID=8895 RepID=UPI0021F8D5BC|nr:basic proline-rich protein-like [Apus apus]